MSIPGSSGEDGGGYVRERMPPRWTSRADRVTYLLAEYRVGVYLALLAAVVLVASGRWQVPELPPQVALAVQGFALGVVPATVVGKVAVVDRYMDKESVNVLVVNLSDGIRLEAHETPPGLWDERRRGDLPELHVEAGPFDWVVSEYDYLDDVGELVVEGVNPEMADPLSIVARNGKLDEIYGDLLEVSQKYTRLTATLQSKATEIERANANALLASYEYGTAFDPGETAELVREDKWSEMHGDADDKDPERSDDPEQRGSVTLDVGDRLDELAGRTTGNSANGSSSEAPEVTQP